MRTREFPRLGLAAAVAAAVLGSLGAAGTAVADTNINVHSPSMACGTGSLSHSSTTSPCVARQGVEQEVMKSRTQDTDLINRLDVAVPALVGG
ncbi:hypothetical protein [Streptomyces sp. PR69]|uniref:hypothetical protein n=1 Tax=Streptomyces sp. PR69 TaxID=2984950 RepID=UPI0022656348|nr:hypothetical protein [Streptomyces sp. PR69]